MSLLAMGPVTLWGIERSGGGGGGIPFLLRSLGNQYNLLQVVVQVTMYSYDHM